MISAAFFLDEDVSVVLAKLLVSRGFSAATVHDRSREGNSDEAQLAFAAAEGMCLLTHNRADFERIAERWRIGGRHHSGIIIAVRRRPQEIAARLLKLMERFPANEIANQVWYV